MRKLANTFVRAGTWRIIDICSKPKVKDGKKFAIRVEKNGNIQLFELVDVNVSHPSGRKWQPIHNSAITIPEDVPEKRVELLWEEKFDFITEDGSIVEEHQKLCNVEYNDGSIVDLEIVHHTSNRGSDHEYYSLWVDGHLTPKSYWLYGDVEEAVYEVIEKRGLVVKPPVRGAQS